MTEYYISEEHRSGLVFPGDYLFSLDAETEEMNDTRILGFPGKEQDTYAQSFAVGKSQLKFYTNSKAIIPVMFWFLKFHKFHDGKYVVTSNSLLEEIVIQDKTITHASIQPLHSISDSNEENARVLHTSHKKNNAKEIRSRVKIPWGYMFMSRVPHFKFILLAVILLLGGVLTLGIALPPLNTEEQSVSNILPEYMKARHIALILGKLDAEISAESPIHALRVNEDGIHINVRSESLLEIFSDIPQAQNSVSMSTVYSEIFSQADTGAVVQGTDVHLNRSYFNIPAPYQLSYADNSAFTLHEGVEVLRNLKNAIESQAEQAVEILVYENRLNISLEGTLSEVVQAIILVSEWQIPIIEFLLENNEPGSTNPLKVVFNFYIQSVVENRGSPWTDHYSYYTNRISQTRLISTIKKLFGSSEPVITNFSKNPSVQQESPEFLAVVGTAHVKEEKYYSFVDGRNGFTVMLKPGEKYGNWVLNESGNFNLQN